MRTILLTLLLVPLVLMAELPRHSTTTTITVQVTFVRVISGEMTEEQIEESARGNCYANPDDDSEILCQ